MLCCYILFCQPISYNIMSVKRYISIIQIHQHSWMLGMRKAPVLASHSTYLQEADGGSGPSLAEADHRSTALLCR